MKRTLQTTIVFVSILASHIFVFLAFYPGICSYDLNAQIEQYTTHDFCTSHPLLHTLYVGFLSNLFKSPRFGEDINLGYAVATVIQLIVVTGAMTYSAIYLYTLSKKISVLIFTAIFYAVFPVNTLLAISHTKDVLFGAFGLIFLIDSIRILSGNLSGEKALFFIRSVINISLMSLMRNNAIYALAATLIILLIIFIRNKNDYTILRKYMLVLLSSVLLSISANKMLIITTDATPGSIKEMMSVPAQIMGRIYNEAATNEEKEIISQYIPNTDEYNFYLADPMKHYLPFEIWESKCKHFLFDSAILSLHHPIVAIKAIWFNVQGFLDPFHQPYSYDRYYLAYSSYRGGATLDSKIPQLCDLYLGLFSSTAQYRHLPVVIFFNLGIYVWLCIVSLIIHVHRKEHAFSISYLFPVLYLFTLLLGPGAIMRYGYLYVLIAPISIYLFRTKNKSIPTPIPCHNKQVADS